MEMLSKLLPIFIYILLIVLIIVCIIIGVKIIMAMNKIEKIVDDVENKVSSLNGLFNIISTTSDKMSGFYSKFIDYFSSIFEKIFINHKKRKDDEDYE